MEQDPIQIGPLLRALGVAAVTLVLAIVVLRAAILRLNLSWEGEIVGGTFNWKDAAFMAAVFAITWSAFILTFKLQQNTKRAEGAEETDGIEK